jgi:protein ImuB
MRYLSLFLPYLPTDRLVRLNAGLRSKPSCFETRAALAPQHEGFTSQAQKSSPHPEEVPKAPSRRATAESAETPLVTFTKIKSALRLVALDPCALALGLEPGLALADARARHPALLAVEADPQAEAKVLTDILDWCRRFTPLAALDAPDGVMLDVTGAVHLFGGEEKLLADIETRLHAQGFAARAALAGTPEAAWALARYGEHRLLPEGLDEKRLTRALGSLPLAALRLDADLIAGLNRAGLRRLSDIIMRPRAPIAARFGAHVFERLDALLGRAKSAISPHFEAPPYLAERRFAEGIIAPADIEATLLSLAHDLCAMLMRHGEGARHIEASFFRVDGAVKHLDVRTSRALRDPIAIARLFRERIEALGEEGLEADYGFDVLRLAALAVEDKAADQTSLDDTLNAESDLADLIDRLGARLGLRRVTRLALRDRHDPDFAVIAVPAAARGRLPESRGQGESHFLHSVRDEVEKGALPARPLRLLLPPELIEAIASVPDGPPLRFRWRRVLHEVAAVEGPERIAPEWWKEVQGFTRDYFRAEDRDGQSFWLYRDGLYRETTEPRWFMHGLFA